MALGAIAEGPERSKFAELIIPSLNQLEGMFQDSSPKVREAIGWVFQQICNNHAECLVHNQENTQKFVGTLVKSLQDQPKISAHCCRAIGHLADSLSPEDREVQRSN